MHRTAKAVILSERQRVEESTHIGNCNANSCLWALLLRYRTKNPPYEKSHREDSLFYAHSPKGALF